MNVFGKKLAAGVYTMSDSGIMGQKRHIMMALRFARIFGARIRPSSRLLLYLILNHHCNMKCACCGTEMIEDKELEKTIIYKCRECGLTNSSLKI
ncbi:MAG: hypothetical protein WAZ77_21090 [Candidatus Nitrosopolaris sp.]